MSISRRVFCSLLLGLPLASSLAAQPILTKARVLMIVTNADKMTNGDATGLWLEEFAVPYQIFRQRGVEVVVASLKGGAAPIDPRSKPTPEQQKSWREASEALQSTKALSEVKLDGIRAVFFPGGHGTMFDLPNQPELARLLEDFDRSDRAIAAVCHGPAAFVGAKGKDGKPLVAGRQITCFTNDEEEAVGMTRAMPFLLETQLRGEGAEVIAHPKFESWAIRSGNLVTGQNPASSAQVAYLILTILSEKGR